MVRMDQKSSSAHSYFKLNSILGSPDMMLLPCSSSSGTSSAAAATIDQKQTSSIMPPIQVVMYVSDGNVHANILCINLYGFHWKTYLSYGSSKEARKACINVNAIVKERVNFNNAKSVCFLKVVITKEEEMMGGGIRHIRKKKPTQFKIYWTLHYYHN